MDLLQPSLMRQIVDDGVLGLNSGGVGDLSLILALGLKMIVLVIFGGFSGSMNNVFTQMCCQNMGNEMRKDVFHRIMTFSFPQMDRFGAGSLITRVTNDITQVQGLIGQFIRGMIRTTMLMAGSIFCLFQLNRALCPSVSLGLPCPLPVPGKSAVSQAPVTAGSDEQHFTRGYLWHPHHQGLCPGDV